MTDGTKLFLDCVHARYSSAPDVACFSDEDTQPSGASAMKMPRLMVCVLTPGVAFGTMI